MLLIMKFMISFKESEFVQLEEFSFIVDLLKCMH